MEDFITQKYWKIKNQIKKINDIINIIKIFIDKKAICSIDNLNETINKTLKEEIENLKEIIGE